MQKKQKLDSYGNIVETTVQNKAYVEFSESDFVYEEIVDGDESFPMESWIDKIKAPSLFSPFKDNNIPLPPVKIVLEHCFGYRVK